jgi:hypothetical protein
MSRRGLTRVFACSSWLEVDEVVKGIRGALLTKKKEARARSMECRSQSQLVAAYLGKLSIPLARNGMTSEAK